MSDDLCMYLLLLFSRDLSLWENLVQKHTLALVLHICSAAAWNSLVTVLFDWDGVLGDHVLGWPVAKKIVFVNAEFMGLWNAAGILAHMMETH